MGPIFEAAKVRWPASLSSLARKRGRGNLLCFSRRWRCQHLMEPSVHPHLAEVLIFIDIREIAIAVFLGLLPAQPRARPCRRVGRRAIRRWWLGYPEEASTWEPNALQPSS
jgi:hypothetical protein